MGSMGKKYIIELEDKPFHKGGDFLYRVKGFNSLVFDMTGVGKLTSYTEPDLEQIRKEAYENGYENGFVAGHLKAEKSGQSFYEDGHQRGLADAWEAARKIVLDEWDNGIKYDDFYELFNGKSCKELLKTYTASECIEKIRQYEQEKEEFHVGDEFENESGERFVILKMDGAEIDRYINEEGKTYCMSQKYKGMRKTGRHFPEIVEVLAKMKEADNG